MLSGKPYRDSEGALGHSASQKSRKPIRRRETHTVSASWLLETQNVSLAGNTGIGLEERSRLLRAKDFIGMVATVSECESHLQREVGAPKILRRGLRRCRRWRTFLSIFSAVNS